MALQYEKMDIRGAEGIRITGYEGNSVSLEIPEHINGLPVLEIGAHAFEGCGSLRNITLPRTVKMLRPFAFYSCEQLTALSLYDTCEDCYDGVIRNCSSLRNIQVYCRGEHYSIIRELLRDVDSTLRFHLIFPDHEVRLTFPEFVSITQEDTMARAFHFSVEGAGMAYRECVSRNKIDFSGYDRMLSRLTDYDFTAGMNIALDRLMTPADLSDRAREAYSSFLRERSDQTLEILIRENDPDRIRFLMQQKILQLRTPDKALRMASARNRTEICALLMEYQRSEKKPDQRNSFKDICFQSENVQHRQETEGGSISKSEAAASPSVNQNETGGQSDHHNHISAENSGSITVFTLEDW